MAVKIGINGFGRIGRQVFKKIYEDYQGVLDVEAVNDLYPVETNGHLLKYDSTYGRFPGKVEVKDGDLYIDGEKLKSYAERDPAKLPWGELGVDIVLECTGIFKDRDSAGKHLEAGAKKVIISAPGKNMDGTFVLGVNADQYDNETMHVISNASCTTNCLAPAAKALNDAFAIETALMTPSQSARLPWIRRAKICVAHAPPRPTLSPRRLARRKLSAWYYRNWTAKLTAWPSAYRS